jgi:hypothetical protein
MRIFVRDQVSDHWEIPRSAKKISAGIYMIFQALFFERDAEIGLKDRLWTDTRYKILPAILYFRLLVFGPYTVYLYSQHTGPAGKI